MSGFDITVDALDISANAETLIETLIDGRSDAPVNRAVNRAIRKTGQWLRRQVTRLAAIELKVSQRTFDKARVRFWLDRKNLEGTLWVGTNPFPAHRLGTVRWNRRMKGARAGRRSFPGTFAPRQDGPVFRRTGKARLPIEVVSLDIDEQLQEQFKRLEARGLRRYRAILEQELTYELHRLAGNA